MNLLVLGGTVFLGRHLVDAALSRHHHVTLFNRGQHNADLYPDLEKLHGDRDGGLGVLKGRNWDAVVDTCGYVPRLVGDSARLLADAVEHYTLISSLSVYDDLSMTRLTESAAVKTLEDETIEEVTPGSRGTYGPLKALCEQAADAVMPGRVLHVRAGLIVGPYDRTDRFTYWVVRVVVGGAILAPPNPGAQVQFIDARDLSQWIIDMAEQKKAGIYNTTGPADTLTFQQFLIACQQTLGSEAEFHWASPDVLAAHEVTPWNNLPLWTPDTARGLLEVEISNAIADGLAFRPLSETIRDTLAWAQKRPRDYAWQAGLSMEREAAVLAASPGKLALPGD